MRILAVLAGGVLYALALPPFDWSACGWLTLVPLLWTIRREPASSALWYGVLYGYASGWAVTWCFAGAAGRYLGLPFPVAVGALSLWYLVVVGLPFGLFGAAATRIAAETSPPVVRIAGTAALWVATEYLRGQVMEQPWGLLGYTQHAQLGLIQLAAWTGVYGVSFVVAAASAALVVAIDTPVPRVRTAATCGLVLLAAGVALGGVAGARAPGGGDVRPVAVVQTNLAPRAQWTRAYTDQQVAAHVRATEALAPGGQTLVVWPENSVPRYLEGEPMLAVRLATLARQAGADLLIGGPRHEGGRTYNSARLITAAGRDGGVYDKHKLVLFAEEQPLARESGGARAASPSAFTPGSGSPVLAGAFRLGVSICHEIVHPRLIAEGVRDGAELLVNIANDGWLDGDLEFAGRQHLAMAVLRAVETRRWLVRTATTGTSAVIDPYGRVVAALPSDTAGVLVAGVSPAHGVTPYVRWGDAFALGCVAVALLQLQLARVPRYRATARAIGVLVPAAS